MRIIITGGAGFLGSHLVDKMIEEKNEVIVVDNLLTGSIKNIEHHFTNPLFTFVKQDVIDPFQDTFGKIDQIYHLACPASPPHYQKNPIHTLETCFTGTKNFLELAKKHGSIFLLTSTSEIYGDPVIHPQVESYRGNVSCTGIRACYDEGKRIGETLCMEYFRMLDVKVKIARLFNTYGPRMALDDGRVVSNFIVQAIKKEPLTVYGEGIQTRSFCYVDDTIKGLIKLMNTENFTGPVNIGNPMEFTIKELCEKITQKIGENKIEYKLLPQDDPTKRKPDIQLAIEKLEWYPLVNLDDGLDKTIEDFKNRI